MTFRIIFYSRPMKRGERKTIIKLVPRIDAMRRVTRKIKNFSFMNWPKCEMKQNKKLCVRFIRQINCQLNRGEQL